MTKRSGGMLEKKLKGGDKRVLLPTIFLRSPSVCPQVQPWSGQAVGIIL